MRLMLACAALQMALGMGGGLPWVLPDLLVMGMVLVISRDPDRWLGAVMVAVMALLLWTTRAAFQIAGSAIALGLMLRLLMPQWNLSDARLLPGVASAGSLVASALYLWLDQAGAPVVMLLALVRAAATWGATWAILRLHPRLGAAEPGSSGL